MDIQKEIKDINKEIEDIKNKLVRLEERVLQQNNTISNNMLWVYLLGLLLIFK